MKREAVLIFMISSLFVSCHAEIDSLDGYIETPTVEIENGKQEPESFQAGVLQTYFIKRFSCAVYVLSIIHEKKLFPFICARTPDCYVFEDDYSFVCSEVGECRAEIERTKSLEPFFALWEFVEKNPAQLDSDCLRELALLVLGIYKKIFTAYSPLVQVAQNKNSLLQALALLCGNISNLHAFELLKIIEQLTVQIPKLLEKYELTKSDLTWKEWIHKYWWLPPVAVSAIVLKSILIYQVAVGKKKLPRFKSLLQVLQKNTKKQIEMQNATAT